MRRRWPVARIRDSELLRRLHLRWRSCALCGESFGTLSLHHVLPKGAPYFGDDLEENLVMLCGSGTTGCHGLIEATDSETCFALGEHLWRERPDTLAYIRVKLGQPAASAWLERHLFIT